MKSYTKILLCGAFLFSFCFSAYASAKTISSVSLKSNNTLVPGEYMYDQVIQINDTEGGDVNIYTTSDKYDIADAVFNVSNDKKLEIGDTISITITVSPTNYDEYRFVGTYSSSNVTLNGGTVKSVSKKDGDLVVKATLKAITGTYTCPDDAYWEDSSKIGKARWTESENGSGYYDVYLYRGNSCVKKIEKHRGTTISLYKYMTSKGTYTFRVRAVPNSEHEKKYAKKSEWTYSDEYYLDAEDVYESDRYDDDDDIIGIGPGGYSSYGPGGAILNQANVGWVRYNNGWRYYYPDGSFKSNGWEFINGEWYRFDMSGYMQIGQVESYGNTYFLKNTGEMIHGWTLQNGHWRYCINDPNSAIYGAMMKNSWIQNGEYEGKYYVGNDGAMYEGWKQIDGNWYYFYPGSGRLASNTVIDTFRVNENGMWVR